MRELRDYLTNELCVARGLDQILAENWAEIGGSNAGGMAGYQLIGRMRQVRWQPPLLSFVVEPYGVASTSPSGGHRRHWIVDLDKRTASIVEAAVRSERLEEGRETTCIPTGPQSRGAVAAGQNGLIRFVAKWLFRAVTSGDAISVDFGKAEFGRGH